MTATPPPDAVLRQYAVGRVRGVGAGGGTAGRTWRVWADSGAYLLRLRGTRSSGPRRLAYDHGLRTHLVAAGLPTVEAVATRSGQRWVRHLGRIYELYPLIDGFQYDGAQPAQRASAGGTLARFHLAAASYVAPCGDERIGQYSALGYGDLVSDRLDDPALQAVVLRALWPLAEGAEGRALVERCLQRVHRLMETYAGAAYARLTGWVVHGDYTPANLLFGPRGAVVGLFDFDWAMPGTRCRDVVDGLYFFGRDEDQPDTADIWTLTATAQWERSRVVAFLQAYQAVAPLAEGELDAIPEAFAARWLSIRLEGMAKVADAERWHFFSRDLELPMRWLEAHWPGVRTDPESAAERD